MRDNEIVHIALENLQKNVGITGTWKDNGPREMDGEMELIVENHPVKFNAEIKQELRNHQLPQIIQQAERFAPLIVVANRIFPKIKEELRNNHIAYLEANGNIYLNQGGIMLWLDGQKPVQALTEKGNRAFTKTGLKVLFHFLLDEQLVQLRYREIAHIINVGLGNVNYIMNGLKELNFLIEVREQTFRLNNKKELMQKWMVAYEERLKPALLLGTFRFLKEEDFLNWKNLGIDTAKTKWGGEPAGDLYTNYLRPQTLTLYTIENRNELIKNYRLIPDEKGNIKVYKKFWHLEDGPTPTVPPLLIYADLMNTNDRRCIETAQKIYDGFLQNKL
jgi:hypothetical protein